MMIQLSKQSYSLDEKQNWLWTTAITPGKKKYFFKRNKV